MGFLVLKGDFMFLKDKLIELESYEGFIEWIGERNLQEAWQECPDGYWLIWLLVKIEEKNDCITKEEVKKIGWAAYAVHQDCRSMLILEGKTSGPECVRKSELAMADYIRNQFTPPPGVVL
jgi:hypothetical protein